MTMWLVKLSKFSLKYEPRGMVSIPEVDPWWTLYVDGSSNSKGGEAGIILEGPGHVVLEHSLKFNFKTSNNQDEFETLLVSLDLALEVDVRKILCYIDSQPMVEHIKGTYQVKDPIFLRYYHKVINMLQKFDKSKIKHISREDNT
ncbi:hypothetical protein CR513_52362, partial [Mucuna pruriens]